MKKLSMISQVSIAFEQGCDRYILNCQQRNLRQGTLLLLVQSLSFQNSLSFFYFFNLSFENY